MQTLTVTKARQNLGVWLARAVAGDDIGVIIGDKIVALRPVEVFATDYAESEYGLTAAEISAATARITAEVSQADTVEYSPGMLTHENPAHKKIQRGRG